MIVKKLQISLLRPMRCLQFFSFCWSFFSFLLFSHFKTFQYEGNNFLVLFFLLQAASSTASSDLAPTHPIRLGLALNFSVFYYEILNSPERFTYSSFSFSLIIHNTSFLYSCTYTSSCMLTYRSLDTCYCCSGCELCIIFLNYICMV